MEDNLQGSIVGTIPLEARGVEARGKNSLDTIPKDSSVQGGLENRAKAESFNGRGSFEDGARGKGQDRGTIRVKFNHEERDIDISEAARLAQQGLKLSSILPEYQRLKNNTLLSASSELEGIAKARGMSVGEYIRKQKGGLSGGNISSGDSSDGSLEIEGTSKGRADDFWKQDRELLGDGDYLEAKDYISKGYSPVDAYKLARVNKIIRDDELRQAEFERTTRQEQEKEAENIRQISEFIEIYPEGDARFNEIVTSPDVAIWLSKGYPLAAAYTLSVSKAVKAIQKNEENRGKSSGSIEGNGSLSLQFSDDEIAGMATKDIAKNFKQIMAVIKDRKK